MDIRHIARAGLVVMAAVLLVTFAFAVAPKATVKAAFAQEATPAATASATAAPAQGGGTKTEAVKEGEAKAGTKEEIPHKVGNPTPSQLQELRFAWASIPGFDLLLVSILGLLVTVGIVGFGAFKQMRV